MKNILIGFSILFSPLAAFSQGCTNYYFLQSNKTIEITIYDRKGNASGKQVYTVSDVKNSGGSTIANLNSELLDKKGKALAKSRSTISCTGGVLMVDMKMNLPQQQAEQINKTEVKAENIYIEYPSRMAVGDVLKEGNLDMEIDNNGMKQTIKMVISNRKVDGKENITTPAGTWECFKISFNGKMDIKMMGIGVPVDLDGTEWFAPGFGVVKTESRQGGTVITAVK